MTATRKMKNKPNEYDAVIDIFLGGEIHRVYQLASSLLQLRLALINRP
jgi:hypothetical protein